MREDSKFFPEHYASSAYGISYETLYNKGYRGIIYDIDNTLVAHGAPANEKAKKLFAHLRRIGFKACLLSNNSKARVELFNRDIGLMAVCNAFKPSRKGFEKAMKLMGTTRENTIMIGDQVFTDIYGANRAKVHNILVSPLDPNEVLMVKFKRAPERLVLRAYKRFHPEEFREGKGDHDGDGRDSGKKGH